MRIDVLVVGVSPFIGSFVGLLIRRLPLGRPIVLARSQCESCQKQLTAIELIPLISWALQRGSCRYCGSNLGYFYPAIELAAVAIALMSAWMLDGTAVAAGSVLGWLLLALALVDFEHFIIPDELNAALLLTGLAVAIWLSPQALLQGIAGMVAGLVSFAAVRHAYFKLRSREGMGFGDVKLLGAGGAWLGWQGLPYAVLVAASSALVATAIQNRGQAQLSSITRIPFGAYLALGIWLAWLAQQHGIVGGSIN